jgi:hypothetical protein
MTDSEIDVLWTEWSPGTWHAGNFMRDPHPGADPFYALVKFDAGEYRWAVDIFQPLPGIEPHHSGKSSTLKAGMFEVLRVLMSAGIVDRAEGALPWGVKGPGAWCTHIGAATLSIVRNRADERFHWAIHMSGNTRTLQGAVDEVEGAIKIISEDAQKKLGGQ